MALERNKGVWRPTNAFRTIRFGQPQPPSLDYCPSADEHMVAESSLLVVDWREIPGAAPENFICARCRAPLCVATHRPDPDGVRRDRLTATSNGSLGLTKLCDLAGSYQTVITSPELKCTGVGCNHKTSMHSEEILAQVDAPPLPTAHPTTRPHRLTPPPPRLLLAG